MRSAGHTQDSCAEDLRTQFGAAHASQALVSRWLSGSISTPASTAALVAYCDHYAPSTGGAAEPRLLAVQQDDAVDDSWALVQAFAAQLDVLRGELRQERMRTKGLSRQVERLSNELALALESVDRMDESASAYSAALHAVRDLRV